MHVLDLAAGHLLALDALSPDSKTFDNCPDEARFKAYNLGKGNGMSVLDIIEAMRKATGFDYKYEIIGRRYETLSSLHGFCIVLTFDILCSRGDVPYLIAEPSLARKELGFEAPQDLDTMCRDLWNWQTKNPEGYASKSKPAEAA